MNGDAERQLREVFARAHRLGDPDGPAGVPSFGRFWPPRPAPAGRRRLIPAAVGLAVALATLTAVLLVLRPPDRFSKAAYAPGPSATVSPAPDDGLDLARSLSRWEGPLDFLLETPAGEVLGSTPGIDPPSGWRSWPFEFLDLKLLEGELPALEPLEEERI